MKAFRIAGRIVVLSVIIAGPAAAAAQSAATIPDDVSAVFQKNCIRCHKGKYPPRGLNLEAANLPGTIVGVPSVERPDLKIVDQGRPETSYLLKKITAAPDIKGERMPLGGHLTEAEIGLIRDWVAGLKPGLPGAPPSSPGDEGSPKTSAAAAPVKRPYEKPAFWGTTVVNLPTTTVMDKGDVLFRVSHRFMESVSMGYDAFWGFDGTAMVYLGFGYGITDKLGVVLGRSRLYQEWDVTASYLVAEQGLTKGFPVSVAVRAGGSWATQKMDSRGRFDTHNIKLHALVSVSYQASKRLSFLAVPALATNTNHWDADPKTNIGLGFGARFMVIEDLSLIAEWTPFLSGYKVDGGYSAWALGIEKKIGGHVFQVFVTDAYGLTPAQFLAGGDLRLGDGDFRFGFNIYRTF
jgi:mono/diheme cytochrome c family protein